MNISGLLFLFCQEFQSNFTIGNELWITLCTSPSGGCRHCRLVGLDGFEPSTSRLSGARSNHLSYKPLLCVDSFPSFRPCLFLYHREWTLDYPLNNPVWWRRTLSAGGDDGIRTHDPLLAGQVLSQLSYTPIPRALFFSRIISGPWKLNNKRLVPSSCVPTSSTRMTGSWHPVPVSIERRWSSRTFRYGYLVTT